MAAAKKKSGKGNERPPEVDKLIKPAIAVSLAMMLYQFFKGINSEVRVWECDSGYCLQWLVWSLAIYSILALFQISLSLTQYFWRIRLFESMWPMKWNWEKVSLGKAKARITPCCVIQRMPNTQWARYFKMPVPTAVPPPNSVCWIATMCWAARRVSLTDLNWTRSNGRLSLFLERLGNPNK